MSEKDKVILMFNALSYALCESAEQKKKWRTSVYEMACQFRPEFKQSDFDQIKNMTIDEITKFICDGK